MIFPDYITHYYSRSDRPFLNLSNLEPDELAYMMSKLEKRRDKNPKFKRVFGKRYMKFCEETEEKLRDLFTEKGGRPERRSPHYFVLGDCPWFAGVYPDTGTVTLDLKAIVNESVSFTYPDSFISMRLGKKYGLPDYPVEPYHEKVFLLAELEGVIGRYGLPDGSAESDYSGYQRRKFSKCIEIQIWSDRPVSAFLKNSSKNF